MSHSRSRTRSGITSGTGSLPSPTSRRRWPTHRVVWAVELDGSASDDLAVLESLGYDIAAVHPVHRTNIVELVKE